MYDIHRQKLLCTPYPKNNLKTDIMLSESTNHLIILFVGGLSEESKTVCFNTQLHRRPEIFSFEG